MLRDLLAAVLLALGDVLAVVRRLGGAPAGDEVGSALPPLLGAPDLSRVARGGPERGIDGGEEVPHVLQVALEEAERLAVVRRPDHLREVDDDRPAPAAEDVVGREVAVDEVAG